MFSPTQGRRFLAVNAAAEEHIVPDLLAAHALTGCVTVASCWQACSGEHSLTWPIFSQCIGPPYSEMVDGPHASCWPATVSTDDVR